MLWEIIKKWSCVKIVVIFYANYFSHYVRISLHVTQYNKRYILSNFEEEKNEIFLHYLTEELTSFPMLQNAYKFKWYFWKCTFPFIFFIFDTLFCSLSQINLAGKMYLLLYWVTYSRQETYLYWVPFIIAFCIEDVSCISVQLNVLTKMNNMDPF